jgi:hypothetical protein
MIADATEGRPWSPRHWLVLGIGLGVAVLVRLLLFPWPGLAGDIDQFALRVHLIATEPFGQIYRSGIALGPVVVYIWGVLATLEPAFRVVIDAPDAWIRALMKTPPTLADFGLALGVAYALRSRAWLAVGAALALVLNPAVIDVSALFGQYESVYVLLALAAFLLAIRGHSVGAAIALALAVATKPQAVPLLVPFGAWFLARDGWLGSVRVAVVGAAVLIALWLPFLPDGGLVRHLDFVRWYQDNRFDSLSLSAWNPWWIIQGGVEGRDALSDNAVVFGPVTFRTLGYLLTAVLAIVVLVWVYRRPSRESLAWGLAAATIVPFLALTTMHERYSYGLLVFLALLFPDRRAVALWVVATVVITLNLLAAVPPWPELRSVVPMGGVVGIVGSVAMAAIGVAVLWQTRRAAA